MYQLLILGCLATAAPCTVDNDLPPRNQVFGNYASQEECEEVAKIARPMMGAPEGFAIKLECVLAGTDL